uniref:Intermembrane lipid transfer protein VPS13-like C-terminal domain-containing protein n=1 Tax=Magallana gigas TaxID=29159 RepID=A0A8W8NLW4_MAGGI
MTDADLKMVYGELLEETGLAKEQKHFFDNLHVSPLKIIFSQSIQLEERQEVHYHDNIFLNTIFRIQNVQEVVLKLGYFEKKNSFLNISQLISQIPRHYEEQATNQIYVIILGHDFFGNPLGLLRGIVEGGADLFYEPYQGAIQGPGEFVEGLALGVRSFVGHTVVGTAGALHRISGSVGKGLAILTFDDEYQKKRQEGLNKKPANIGEGLLRGMKGIGKGLVGVITRPSSGMVDFVSSSFEAIKRTADLSDEVKRIRPPRRFYSDKIIRPFNLVEAIGFNFLQETEEGMFAETDEYITHCVNTGDNKSTKSIFLITDRRVIYAKKGVMLGHWEAEWSYTWDDLKERPKQHDEKVEFLLKDKRRSPFQKRSSTEIIKTSESRIAEWLVSEISKAMNMK